MGKGRHSEERDPGGATEQSVQSAERYFMKTDNDTPAAEAALFRESCRAGRRLQNIYTPERLTVIGCVAGTGRCWG